MAIKLIISQIMPSKDDGSFIQLDKEMRKSLKRTIVILLLICVAVICLSFYYFNWTPAVTFINQLTAVIKGEAAINNVIAELIIFAVGIFLLILFYFVFDTGKLHYKIDKIIFKVIPDLNTSLYKKTSNYLECNSDNCSFKSKIIEIDYQNDYRHRFFYNYTNRPRIGDYNQKDTRRNVFKQWTKYYIFNLIFIFSFFIYVWLGFLYLIIDEKYISIKLVAFFILLIIGILSYLAVGKKYKKDLIALANLQLDMIFLYLPEDAVNVLRAIFGNCQNANCKLYQ